MSEKNSRDTANRRRGVSVGDGRVEGERRDGRGTLNAGFGGAGDFA